MGRKPDFDEEMERLQRRVPSGARRVLKSAGRPGAMWVRIPLAIALMIGGLLGFLPLLGFWMFPLGLALTAFDLPFLRKPLARMLAFINEKAEPRAG
jgi:fatty acid desaturase